MRSRPRTKISTIEALEERGFETQWDRFENIPLRKKLDPHRRPFPFSTIQAPRRHQETALSLLLSLSLFPSLRLPLSRTFQFLEEKKNSEDEKKNSKDETSPTSTSFPALRPFLILRVGLPLRDPLWSFELGQPDLAGGLRRCPRGFQGRGLFGRRALEDSERRSVGFVACLFVLRAGAARGDAGGEERVLGDDVRLDWGRGFLFLFLFHFSEVLRGGRRRRERERERGSKEKKRLRAGKAFDSPQNSKLKKTSKHFKKLQKRPGPCS